MARSIGIDLGTHTVKVALTTSGFRQSTVVDYLEAPVPGGAGPGYLQRAAAVAGQLLAGKVTDQDSVFVTVPGSLIHARVLEFGFKGLKRAELEKVVGGELEGVLPFDMDEIVFDFDTLPRDVGDPPAEVTAPQHATDDDEPTFVQGGDERPPRGAVAPPAAGMRVFVTAMPIERARDVLDAVAEHVDEPRGLVVGPTSYARIAERVQSITSAEPAAIIDMGHSGTNVCVVKGGRVLFARSIGRGGRDVTLALARAFGMSEEQAEEAKHADGVICSETEPPASEAWARIHAVTSTELEPLARELRRTFLACLAEIGVSPATAVIVGGASRLRGLPIFLTERLGIPVSPLGADDVDRLVGPELAGRGLPADVAAQAIGVAFEGATGRPTFDLRRGELAYKADFGFLRQKAPYLAAVALVLIAFAAGNAYAALYKLRRAEKALNERCAVESVQVFGRQMGCDEIATAVGPTTAREVSPVPKMSAYDVLLEINSKLPKKDEITIDVKDIDIRPTKVTLQATAASPAEIDLLEKKLKEIECFTDITRGSIAEAPGGGKAFSFNITMNCMGLE